jgi:hypothetical protein
MTHRFSPGQAVRFCRGYPYRNAADGLYEVKGQLPYSEGDYQYRIKSSLEHHDRVVKESELETA